MVGKWEMEGKDFAILPFASWHIRDFALLANMLIKILARGVGQSMYKNISSQKSPLVTVKLQASSNTFN